MFLVSLVPPISSILCISPTEDDEGSRTSPRYRVLNSWASGSKWTRGYACSSTGCQHRPAEAEDHEAGNDGESLERTRSRVANRGIGIPLGLPCRFRMSTKRCWLIHSGFLLDSVCESRFGPRCDRRGHSKKESAVQKMFELSARVRYWNFASHSSSETVKPAALRWPPPPNPVAIVETSRSPIE